MNKKISTLGFIGICGVFLLQGSTGSLNSAVAGIASGLNMDPTVVGQVGTLPAIFVVISSLLIGTFVGKKIKYRTTVMFALLVYGIGGTLPLFIQSWPIILFSRACVGIGVGAFYTLAPALILKFYEGAKQGNFMGIGNAVATVMGILMPLIVGFLVDVNWYWAFAFHLFAIIAFVFVAIGLPEPEKDEDNKETEKVKVILPLKVYINCLVIMLFMMFTLPLILSLSVIITENGFGTGLESGVAMSMFAIGGTVLSLVFGPLYKALGKFTTVGVLMVTIIGMLVVYFASNLIMIFVGMFIVGSGLLIFPSLMMDNNKLVDSSSAATVASTITIFMYIGNFLAGYFLQIAFSIGAKLTVPYPGLFVSIISMAVLTVIWFVLRLLQKEPQLLQE